MHPLSQRWRAVAAAVPVVLLVACGQDTPVDPTLDITANRDVVAEGAQVQNIVGEVTLQIGQQTLIKTKNSRAFRTPVWTSTNPAVATVNSSGMTMAVAEGDAYVTVSGFATFETHRVRVLPAPRETSLSLFPKVGASLVPGQTQQFGSNVTWTDGTTRTSTVTYQAEGGTISNTGLFTAGQAAGVFAVVATCTCGFADTASASVAGLSSLDISPASATVAAGATRQFTASALWSNGATIMPPVSYTANGGSVSAAGLYTAPTAPGTYRVIVSHVGGTTADTAMITVPAEAAQLTALTISPKTVTLAPGATRQFTATANWSTGATTVPPISYRALNGGSVSLTGLFTAPTTGGTYRVEVSHTGGTLKDTATVTVTSPTATLTSLSISPKTVTVPTGGTQQFNASAVWSNGTTALPPVAYSVLNGGTVSGTGLFTAPASAGTYRVVVAHTGGTRRDTATVTVQVQQSPTSNSFGPGPNAPAWSGKTVYQEELFNTPIPVHYGAANSAGFKGWLGFDGGWGGIIYNPTRVTYPTVNTPLGTKRVLEVTYPGSSQNISAVNGASAVWPTDQPWGVRVTGTWSGTLVFERSDDGVTWTQVSLSGTRAGTGVSSQSGTQASVNGVWISTDAQATGGGKFRVRASTWLSGTAMVAVGMRGGAGPVGMSAGNFSGNPTRIYTRALVFVDPNWTNGGNTGTKFFFFSQQQGNNHFTGVIGGMNHEGVAEPFIGLQQTSNRNVSGTPLTGPAQGQWWDVEYVFVANTPGSHNGTVRMWINGVSYIHATNVMHFAAGRVPGFSSLWMDPTYGGGNAPPPRNIFFRIAGWYRESAP